MTAIRTWTRLVLLLVLLGQTAWAYELGRVRRACADGRRRVQPGEIVFVLDRNAQGELLVVPGRTAASPRLPVALRVSQSDLDILSTQAQGMARLDDPEGTVNLRRAPGLQAAVVRALPTRSGATCVFILESGEWSRVLTASGELGYIHTSRLVPVVLTGGDEADRSSLIETVLKTRLQKTNPKAAYVMVELGLERVCYDLARRTRVRMAPLDASLKRCSVEPGWSGIYGDWALIYCNEFDREGTPIYFGGGGCHVMHREPTGWVQRGQECDRGVTGLAGQLPAQFLKVFQLYYYPE